MFGLCNDDQGYVDGWDNDAICDANGLLGKDGGVELPKQIILNQFSDPCGFNFGSIHAALNVVFCDGSVHGVRYDIDPTIWHRLCVINDGFHANFEE